MDNNGSNISNKNTLGGAVKSEIIPNQQTKEFHKPII